MLEKLKENPSAVVAGLVAAGVLAIAVGAGGGTTDNAAEVDLGEETAQTTEVTDESQQAEDMAVDPESTLDESQEASVEQLVEASPEAGPVVVSKSDSSLSAAVRSGDNQTVIIRQMIDDFAAQSGQSLSAEQRLYVETNVVNTLPRNDLVHPDDMIVVEEQVISDYVAMSRDLTEGQIAAWSQYL